MHRLNVLSRQLTAVTHAAVPTDAVIDRPPLIPSEEAYKALYKRSVEDPAGFWAEQASNYVWTQRWVDDHAAWNFDASVGPIKIEWFKGGKTNLCFNCLDRWVEAGKGTQPCFYWEGNNEGRMRAMTYKEVLDEVCRLSNYLKAQGVKKGDAVSLYMPLVCELPIAMLACARIGAVHSVVFAGFSAEALAQRIMDCKSNVVITASGVLRGTKPVELKGIVDDALGRAAKQGHVVKRVLCLEKAAVPKASTPWVEGRDQWYKEVIPTFSHVCAPEWVDSEHRLFLLYTSGSTGKPKGVVHTTGGYMVGAGVTTKFVFDLRPGDVYWCTADPGWITGHSYLVYGPLLNNATVVLFGSTPNHPNPGRCWSMIERYRVRQFYTSPTALRSLLMSGDSWVTKYDRSSLRVLGSVGEPINEHAWRWYHDVVGDGRCPIVDTWWQTETGMIMITPLPEPWCAKKAKPSCAMLPFFGVQPVVLDTNGRELPGATDGVLAIKAAWPGMARTLHGDHQRFSEVYFGPFKGYYFTGDGCKRDEDGHIWITGRVDDVINVSGHRIGTAEVEDALTAHADCAEAAVVGVDHPVKGSAIYAYVVLNDAAAGRHSDATRKALLDFVRKEIGPFAVPEVIHWAPGLPKTRSGKIMRRILRKIAAKADNELGDISTLADPGVVEALIKLRGK